MAWHRGKVLIQDYTVSILVTMLIESDKTFGKLEMKSNFKMSPRKSNQGKPFFFSSVFKGEILWCQKATLCMDT